MCIPQIRRILGLAIFFYLGALSVSIAKAEESRNYFIAGLGIVSSQNQDDIMSETYSDFEQSGGGSMINLEAGYSFGVGGGFSIVPKVNYMAYRAEFKTGNFPSSTKSNTFFIPGVSVRYNFSESRNSLYISGHVGKNSASSDFSRVNEIKADGVVTGISVGYIWGRLHLEIGTVKIPVTIDTDTMSSRSSDFGGTYFTIKGSTQ